MTTLPVLTDIEFEIHTIRSSFLGHPIEPVVTVLSPPSTFITSNPTSPDAKSDTLSTTQDLFFVIYLCNLYHSTCHYCSIATYYYFILSWGRLREKSSSCDARARSNDDFSVCKVMQTGTTPILVHLQLLDSIKESTSLVWLELWRSPASTHLALQLTTIKFFQGASFLG